MISWSRLTLAELRSATSCFETVFLTLFHTRISGEESGALQDRPVLSVCLQQSPCDAMTDRTGLSGIAAALDIDKDIKLAVILGRYERLTNDNL